MHEKKLMAIDEHWSIDRCLIEQACGEMAGRVALKSSFFDSVLPSAEARTSMEQSQKFVCGVHAQWQIRMVARGDSLGD